jgi:hypothetical protein
VILEERSAIVTGSDRQIGLAYDENAPGQHLIRVSLPAGAYPAGTRVTIRKVTNLAAPNAMSMFVYGRSNFVALQVLPVAQTPALPLHVELTGHGSPGVYVLWHARESDMEWTVTGELEATATTMSFAIGEPGLWAVGHAQSGGAPDGGHD